MTLLDTTIQRACMKRDKNCRQYAELEPRYKGRQKIYCSEKCRKTFHKNNK